MPPLLGLLCSAVGLKRRCVGFLVVIDYGALLFMRVAEGTRGIDPLHGVSDRPKSGDIVVDIFFYALLHSCIGSEAAVNRWTFEHFCPQR